MEVDNSDDSIPESLCTKNIAAAILDIESQFQKANAHSQYTMTGTRLVVVDTPGVDHGCGNGQDILYSMRLNNWLYESS